MLSFSPNEWSLYVIQDREADGRIDPIELVHMVQLQDHIVTWNTFSQHKLY